MTTRRRARRAVSFSIASAFALILAAAPLAGRDVYKGFLDPGIPQHRATLDLLKRIEKTPDDATLHNDLACLIARDGFWRDALREFEIAAKLDKTDGRPLYNAGLVHAMRGEWGSAASSFRKAVSRSPGNWSAWWMLGYAEERRGNDSAAVAAYKTSLRVDTSLFDVRRNPYAVSTRLKERVLLETLDERKQRIALPVTEQIAQADLVTTFQQGRVAVSAVPGGPVPSEAAAPGAAGGVKPGEVNTVQPAARSGPVVTSVPPVSTSRPSPSSPSSSRGFGGGSSSAAPTPVPTVTSANESIPTDFPAASAAGAAPARPRVQPGPGGSEDAPTPAPTPVPPATGPGVG